MGVVHVRQMLYRPTGRCSATHVLGEQPKPCLPAVSSPDHTSRRRASQANALLPILRQTTISLISIHRFCFIPLIPFSLKPYHDVGCHICNFHQDVKFRPDVQSQMNGGDAGAHSGIPMQPQNQGWGQGPPHGQQQYQQGEQPVYK